MNNLRSRFERFCFRHREKGIPNLMLYLSIGCAVIYVVSNFANNFTLYRWLCFDREAILAGQVWRLFSYVLTYAVSNPLLFAVGLFCYYSIGKAMENQWGTLRFNLFYLSGMVLMDIYCMLFGGAASVAYLNLSLFLSYATMYPNTHFLLLFIIPIKAWVFALFYLAIAFLTLFTAPIPDNLFPLVALTNYFLYFGKDVLNVIPVSWRVNAQRLFKKKPKASPVQAKPIQFNRAGSYEASVTTAKAPYTHRCTICGRTDVSNPDLEFRYCSRCSGYYCYCQDHIDNHTHIQ